MKMQRFLSGCAIAGLVSIAGVNQAQAILAYGFDGVVGNQSGNSAYALGTAFHVNSDIVVNALGAFDNGGNGMAQPVSVAIYDLDTGFLVIPAVTLDTSDPLVGNTRLETLTSTVPNRTLVAGNYLLVANNYGGVGSGFERNWNAHDATVSDTYPTIHRGPNLELTFGGNQYAENQASWTVTLPGTWTADQMAIIPGYAAGNFDFTPVPEASHFALAGIGLLGLVYTGRTIWLRRKLVA